MRGLRAAVVLGVVGCGPQQAEVDAASAQSEARAELSSGPTELRLYGGDSVTGYLAAVNDHRRWYWSPSNELTYVLADPSAFSANAVDDHSYRFISSYDVRRVLGPTHGPVTEVRDFARAIGFTLDRPPLVGVAYVWTGNDQVHLRESGYGTFAWDFQLRDAQGRDCHSPCTHNADWVGWAAPIVLPMDGTVIEVQSNWPDNEPGVVGRPAQTNLVAIATTGNYQLWLLHLKQGSVPSSVVVGAHLAAGTVIGALGNSGFSVAPHVHVEPSWWDAVTGRGWGVPAELGQFYWSRSPTGPSRYLEHGVPQQGDYVSSTPF